MSCYGYGVTTLTVTSPAQSFCEPLTLGEVKSFLGLVERSPVDEKEDAELEEMIISARGYAELYGRTQLIEKQWDRRLDYFPRMIELYKPLKSVDLIQYKDSGGVTHNLVENVDYIVDTARGLVMPVYGGSWPSATMWPSSAILVRFTAGPANDDPFWSDEGQIFLRGMKQLISGWYNERIPWEIAPGSQTAVELPFGVKECFSAFSAPRAF